MFAYLNGRVAEILPDTVVLDVGGVGYALTVSEYTRQRIGQAGEERKLFTHLSVREDGITLFGFLDREELLLFRMLLGVTGIGPKAAISVLSSFSPSELRFAILADDSKTISKAPGIGTKTAKRIILECKDKMDIEEAFAQEAEGAGEAPMEGNAGQGKDKAKKEAIEALKALGYTPTESLTAVNKAGLTGEEDVETILKLALKQMI